MFDFEKLDAYTVSKVLKKDVLNYLLKSVKDQYIQDQWKRATMSVMLNLAIGTSRMSPSEKKHFYAISRSSVFECAAILDICEGLGEIDTAQKLKFYEKYEKISKMLLGMYRNIS